MGDDITTFPGVFPGQTVAGYQTGARTRPASVLERVETRREVVAQLRGDWLLGGGSRWGEEPQ